MLHPFASRALLSLPVVCSASRCFLAEGSFLAVPPKAAKRRLSGAFAAVLVSAARTSLVFLVAAALLLLLSVGLRRLDRPSAAGPARVTVRRMDMLALYLCLGAQLTQK